MCLNKKQIMKTNTIPAIATANYRFLSVFQMQTLLVITLLILGLNNVTAQIKEYTQPSWMFGVAVGTNSNFYRGATFMLNEGFTPPTAFHNGLGIGFFIAPNIEYHKPGTRLGFQFQVGYDSREGKFNQVTTPCNCPADLETKLSYISIEPSFRLAPFRSNLYLYGGPRFAFIQNKSFTYIQGINPDYPLQVQNSAIKSDFSAVNNTLVSMQIGLGYDIPLHATKSKTQFILSPFASYHPYFGQNPRSVETWNISTVRFGVVLKFGQGHLIEKMIDEIVSFSIVSPTPSTYSRVVREVFPIRNYVFFNLNDTEIPNRYIILSKNEVTNFRSDQVPFIIPKNMSGRSERQMIVYYNILNILGDRMVKYPETKITLVGSSENGPQEGILMAQNIKNYLTTIFEIKEIRIALEGRNKPEHPSETTGGTRELKLLREGDQRVSIESDSSELLMEFQTGKNTPLKPIEIIHNSNDDIVFNVLGAEENLKSWSVEISDNSGTIQKFGPYKNKEVTISRTSITNTSEKSDYKVKMTGITNSGKTIYQESTMNLTPLIIPVIQESIRFSIIYEFNESKSIAIYETYLTKIVTPKIPKNSTVTITGHTDIIGATDYNQELSLARANDVKSILEKSLAALGRTDVSFKIRGEGENQKLAPFENNYPEERFYNRTVVIDISQ
jgi:outer membrane protein OmpA-like peptidoglycan-associated protein